MVADSCAGVMPSSVARAGTAWVVNWFWAAVRLLRSARSSATVDAVISGLKLVVRSLNLGATENRPGITASAMSVAPANATAIPSAHFFILCPPCGRDLPLSGETTDRATGPTSVGATDPGRNDPNSVALIVFIAFSEGDSTELAQLPGGGAPPPGFCVAAPQEWWRAPQANPAQAVVRGSRMTTRVSSTVPIAPVRVSFGCTGQLPSTSPISLANLSRGSYSPVPSTPGQR